MVIFVKCEMRRARSSYNEKNPARKRLGYIYYYCCLMIILFYGVRFYEKKHSHLHLKLG